MSLTTPQTQLRLGLFGAFVAYLCWGLFPLYWRPLHQVPALEILAHRIAWSVVFLALLLTATRQWAWLSAALRAPRVLGLFALSATLLSLNWFIYIWAVNAGRVVEASLGYFINPLVNVVLGRLVLNERLRVAQQASLGLAFIGVVWLTWSSAALPWVALVLAVSFGLYGLLRKIAPLGSLQGLMLETLVMSVPALGYLLWLELTHQGHFGHSAALTDGLLAGSGVITALPLLLFAAAARRLPLSVMGVMQYLSPSLQFAVGVLVFHESLTAAKVVGFAFIWAALLSFSLEGLWASRRWFQSGA